MSAYASLRDEAWQANQALAQSGLVLETFGNVSALDRERGVFAIKPSGVPYPEMSPDDMVVVDLEGAVVWGRRNPSSDTPTHRVLYRSFPTLGGVCHTHSTYATAWAQARLDIPVLGTTHADFLPQAVPCTDPLTDAQIAGDYEIETGLAIVRRLEGISPADVPMALVACHGPFTWGTTALASVRHGVILENLAKMAWLSRQLRPDVSPVSDALIQKHYRRKHGPEAYYGQQPSNKG